MVAQNDLISVLLTYAAKATIVTDTLGILLINSCQHHLTSHHYQNLQPEATYTWPTCRHTRPGDDDRALFTGDF